MCKQDDLAPALQSLPLKPQYFNTLFCIYFYIYFNGKKIFFNRKIYLF